MDHFWDGISVFQKGITRCFLLCPSTYFALSYDDVTAIITYDIGICIILCILIPFVLCTLI